MSRMTRKGAFPRADRRALLVVLGLVTAVAMSTMTLPAAYAAPGQPGPLSVSSVTATSAVLSWDLATTDDVIGYRVYRGLASTPDADLTLINTTDAKVTSYAATGLRSGYQYRFAVAALDADNAESVRSTTMVTTASGATDTVAPAAPTSSAMALTAFSESRVDLGWAASSSTDVSFYEVLRGGSVVGTVERPAALRFSDNGLAGATTYSYGIRAVDSAGNRSTETIKSVKTLAPGTVKIVRGPYTMGVTGSSAVVAWYTNIPAGGVLSIAGATLGEDTGSGTLHRVRVSELSPGTTYSYTVSSGGATSTGTFSTAAPPGMPFSFAVIGDFGGGGTPELQNATNIAGFGTAFTQTVGDNVYPSSGFPDPDPATTYSDLDARIFKQFGPAFRSQAFSFLNGNKEYYGDGQFWRSFPMPSPGRGWYSYDWGDAHFLVLDAQRPYAPGTEQYAFAEADLASNQSASFRLAFVHNPPYNSVTPGSGSAGVRRDLVPLFEAQNVDLVVSGDTHNYQRSFPLLGGEPASGGVTYVVSGGGGNGLNGFSASSPQPAWQAYREAVYQTLKIDVSPDTLTLTARAAVDNSVIDSVTLQRRVADTTPPTAPYGLVANAASASTVDLSWTASADAVGVAGYDVYRDGVVIGSVGAVTTFTDSSVSAATAYSYSVRARDAAGNVSASSNTATVTTPSPSTGSTVTFAPVADARVQQSAPTTNYGTANTLQADMSSTAQVESYLKFALSGLSGSVTSAKLRVWTTSGSTSPTTNGPTVRGITDTTWAESELTWSNRPAQGAPLDDVGALAADSLVEYDVTPWIAGNGTTSLALVPDSGDGTSFGSREAKDPTRRPQLVITTAAQAAPDTTAPTAPSGVAASASSATAVDVSWTASTDAVGVTGYDIYRDSALVGSVGAVTTFTDSSVSASTAYSYMVKARDAAGNVSASSNTATVTTPAAPTGATVAFAPVADARVQQSAPTTNYGTANTLQVASSATAQVQSYLRFDVSGLSGTVVSAKLRLWTTAGTTSPTNDGPALRGVADTAWTENGITWENRPTADATVLDNQGALIADVMVEYDLKAYVSGDGTYSFVLMPESTDGTSFNSREGIATAKRPQLVVTTI